MPHAECIPSKNYSFLGVTPHFEGEFSNSGDGHNWNVHWQFVQKTKAGDLYLLSVQQKEHSVKNVPILYTGSSLTAYDYDGIVVKMATTDRAN